jgi:Tfp pilus assembly protein PilN
MISTFMRAIQASSWMQTPKLKIIQSLDKPILKINDFEQMSDFILSATQTTEAIQLPNESTHETIRR